MEEKWQELEPRDCNYLRPNLDMILEESRLTKLLESSKCLDGSNAFIRSMKGRIDHSYVTVKFVPCFLISDPGVECAPI